MPSASVDLFVYGSLKRGGRHHDELEGATFLGLAVTAPGYRLEPLGEYLALVRAEPGEAAEAVSGELFEVPLSKLPDLDAFEGDAYARAELPVRLAHAKPEPESPPPAQAKPERHETETETHPTQAQAKPERHATETETETATHPTQAQAKPERHETEARGNSAETRLALAYFRKAR
jgi:gamma-glutamylcyclotransferase (GGCT)/AIG2-like uncharacterized protein YtfP